MTTRDHTYKFIAMRNAHKISKADISEIADDEKTTLFTHDRVPIHQAWLPYTETAKSNLMLAKGTLKKLEKLMSQFFAVTFDDDDDIKLQGITNMSKTLTNQLNTAKNALLSANAIPIRSKNQNEISMRQNIISDLVKQLDDFSKLFNSKQKTFMSKYNSMVSSSKFSDEFWNPVITSYSSTSSSTSSWTSSSTSPSTASSTVSIPTSSTVLSAADRKDYGWAIPGKASSTQIKTSTSLKTFKNKNEQIPLLADLEAGNVETFDNYIQRDNQPIQAHVFAKSKEVELMTETINQRDLEITKLAESVEEVAQLFRDLHLLTLDQGKTIDTIDTNLESTSHNVESGIGQIREANNLQKKGRPIRCCILLVVVIMILIAVILVSVLTRTS